MKNKILGFGFCLLVFSAYASGQTVTGTEFTESPSDTFSDSGHTMSNYGLTWADFSNGTIGPSAMLSGYGGINLYTNEARRLTINSNGNVGIGTTGPEQLLQVGATYSQNPALLIGGNDNNNSSTGAYALLFGAWRDVEANMASGIVATPVWTCCGGYPSGGYAGIRTNNLGLYTFYDPANPGNYSPQLYISGFSNYVGIGTTSPGAKLEVNGNLKLTSGSGASITFADGSQQTTAWTGALCGGDYAESVDVTGKRARYEPGDVLVVDPNTPGNVLESAEPYSTSVAGIYSTKPGLVGRREGAPKNPEAVPMAIVGIVPTKVIAENGPIHPGDLLVTSSTLGYAMRGTDRSKMLGAVVGKAMGSLESGKGMIEVLVTLQ